MRIDVAKKIKKDAYLTKGEQAVKFVRDHTDSEDLDEPWLTSRRLLLSFGFELILKSRVISLLSVSDEAALEKKLKYISHNFDRFNIALKGKLDEIGIIDIQAKSDQNHYSYYVIKTKDMDIEVENLNDVRYSNKPRANSSDEHKKIKDQANKILEISSKIREKIKND